MYQYVERLRNIRLRKVVPFDDGLVSLGSSLDVVRLDGQQFLEDVGCTEGLKGPYLHLAEALATKLRLTTQRLLRNEGVWPDGTSVHLVINHVAELEHVDHTYRSELVETVARFTVVEVSLTKARQLRLLDIFLDLRLAGTVEDRRTELHAQLLARPTKDGLEDLAQVHARRYTKWVQNDVDGGSVFQEWHVLIANDAGYNSFVTVAAGEFVPHLQLTLLSEVNLGQFQYASGEFVTHADVEALTLIAANFLVHLDAEVVQQAGD